MRRDAVTAILVCLLLASGGAESAAAGSAWRDFPIRHAAALPRGQRVYLNFCEACHGSGVGKPGTAALQAKYKGALPALLTMRTDLTKSFVKQVVRHGVSMMPFFRKTELSDADLDALAQYLARHLSVARPSH